MNVIFLDIDGVLVTPRSCAAGSDRTSQNFDAIAAALLRRVCVEHKAKIVISSTWRLRAIRSLRGERFNTRLYENLTKSNLVEFCHDDWVTKDLRRFTEGVVRGDEIKEWLSRHPEVTKYVILDDDVDMLDEQKLSFIHTDMYNGLSYQDYRQMGEIFKSS